MPSDDAKLNALNDHYKDTFAQIQTSIRQREWQFAYTLILSVVMLFQIATPQLSGAAISQLLNKQLGIEGPVDASFVGSVVWFLLFASMFRYIQTTVYLEKQYDYIHNLEEVLSYYYNGTAFTREGRAYLSRYPMFSQWAHFQYRGVFPLLLLGLCTYKISSEGLAGVSVAFGFNFLIFTLIAISIGIYLTILNKVRVWSSSAAKGMRKKWRRRKDISRLQRPFPNQ